MLFDHLVTGGRRARAHPAVSVKAPGQKLGKDKCFCTSHGWPQKRSDMR